MFCDNPTSSHHPPNLSPSRRSAVFAKIAIFCLIVGATSLFGQVDPHLHPKANDLDAALRGLEMKHSDLAISNVYSTIDQIEERIGDQTLRAPVVDDLIAGVAGAGAVPDSARLDVRTGRWGTLLPSTPLLPGKGQGNQLSWNAISGVPSDLLSHRRLAWERFVTYLQDVRDLPGFELDLDELPLGRVTVHGDGELVQIHVDRRVGDIPVRRSYLTATISHGNLVLLGMRNWGDIDVSTTPTISYQDARRRMQEALGGGVRADREWRKPTLVLVPAAREKNLEAVAFGEGLGYRLAWSLAPQFGDHYTRHEALIDAHDGEWLAFEDQNRYHGGASSARTVVGGVFPISNDGDGPDGTEQAGWPLPFATMTAGADTFPTDSGGNLNACVSGSVSTDLTGTYLIINDECGDILESSTGAQLDFGVSGGTDCTVPPGSSDGNTHAARSAFYELNRLMAMARGQLPTNDWLEGLPLVANVNVSNQTCNAFFNAGNNTVSFVQSGNGCANTGELASIFDHEWAHVMDFNDANGMISDPGEGIADIYSVLRLDEPCIGRGFFLSGATCSGPNDACLSCDGVRDIDWANHASGQPHDLAWIDANCSSGAGSLGPCGGGIHCEGHLTSESIYDLYRRDLQTINSLDAETARELTTRLTYLSAGMVGQWFNCSPGTGTGDGCNADGGYLNFLASDDDNGNLNDGTPHMQAIFSAFDRHGIACTTPTVQDSGCSGARTSAPVLTATPRDRGVTITWPEVSGAVKYRVYRSDGLGSETATFGVGPGAQRGKSVLGEPIGPPPPTAEEMTLGPPLVEWDDENLLNGRTYYYTVYAIGNGDSCLGPASSIEAVIPVEGGNLSLVRGSSDIAISGGDGDIYFDNCETAQVSFSIDNIGIGAIDNVVVTRVSSPSHPAMDGAITFTPSLSASLAECDRAAGSFDVIGTGLSHLDTVEFEVCYSGDGLVEKCSSMSFENAQTDLSVMSSVTYDFEASQEDWTVVEGIFTRDGSGGAGGSTFAMQSSVSTINQCDHLRSPVVRLTETSTLEVFTNYDIEPIFNNTSWWDRANLGVYDQAAGQRTTVDPDGGRLYNAFGGTQPGCGITGQNGWADSEPTWGASTWSANALGSAGFVGKDVQIDVRYGTDGTITGTGFGIDRITLTDISQLVPDAQGCLLTDGFESGDLSRWSTN